MKIIKGQKIEQSLYQIRDRWVNRALDAKTAAEQENAFDMAHIFTKIIVEKKYPNIHDRWWLYTQI